jgi:hypothetical protein
LKKEWVIPAKQNGEFVAKMGDILAVYALPYDENIPLVCYEAFPAEKARAIAERLEIHYTPKHGSWLNIAEIELSAMARQCLNRRIGDLETLKKEISAWATNRNLNAKSVDWHFTTDDARGKLKSLYPKI